MPRSELTHLVDEELDLQTASDLPIHTPKKDLHHSLAHSESLTEVGDKNSSKSSAVLETIDTILESTTAKSRLDKIQAQAKISNHINDLSSTIHEVFNTIHSRLSNAGDLEDSDNELLELLNSIYDENPHSSLMSSIRARLSKQYPSRVLPHEKLKNNRKLREKFSKKILSQETLDFLYKEFFLLGGDKSELQTALKKYAVEMPQSENELVEADDSDLDKVTEEEKTSSELNQLPDLTNETIITCIKLIQNKIYLRIISAVNSLTNQKHFLDAIPIELLEKINTEGLRFSEYELKEMLNDLEVTSRYSTKDYSDKNQLQLLVLMIKNAEANEHNAQMGILKKIIESFAITVVPPSAWVLFINLMRIPGDPTLIGVLLLMTYLATLIFKVGVTNADAIGVEKRKKLLSNIEASVIKKLFQKKVNEL